jgi:FkbM family methyltransferase
MEPFNVLTQTRYGQMLINRHDVYIGRALDLYGEWSEGEIDLFRQVLRPGMVAVDAGANIGTHTVAMAQFVAPNGTVYAFEPQRIVFQTLAANVALNSLANVFCLQRALGEAPGVLHVPPLDYTVPNNFGGVELGGATHGERVEIMRIDDLDLPACHLIKIDVEGMELAVLKGAAETIKRCQPLLYVEADRVERRDEVIAWLDAQGYALYWHTVPLYNPTNARGNATNVFPGVVSLNVLAIPSTVPQEVAGLERVTVPARPATPDARPAPPEIAKSQRASTDPQPRRRARAARTARLPAARRRAPDAASSDAEPAQPASLPTTTGAATPPTMGAATPPTSEALRPMLERAVAYHEAGRFAEAATLYEVALAVNPDEADALHLLGQVRREERRFDEALALIGRAVALVPDQPMFHFNVGSTYRQMGRLAEAEGPLRRALALSPQSEEAYFELALLLIDRREFAPAEAILRSRLALSPNDPRHNFGLGILLLLTGRYADGWPHYASRRGLLGVPAAERDGVPRWDGGPLDGRTILLDFEEGHGDTIQFVRYAPLVAARGARVVLRCRPELQALLRTVDGVSQVVGPADPLPPVDCTATLPDLPPYFGTTLETIPGRTPYLHIDPARVEQYRARLEAIDGERGRPARRVGLAWAGSPDHRLNGQRSTTLAELAPLGAAEGVRFYGLQKGGPAVEALTPPAGLDFVDLGPTLGDFADTAALVSLLDLVITVDTSVAHLAGAIGRPCWVMPWATHDWRWLLGRDDSPWYPSLRLFRQQTPNAWGPVVARVAEALVGRPCIVPAPVSAPARTL